MLDAPARPVAVAPALAAAGVSGALVALQSRINGELRLALDGAVLAAVVSFGVGWVLIAVAVLARRGARARLARLRAVPPWVLLGGLGGATLVAVAAASAPVLGVALLTLGLVAGQVLGGLLADRAGLAPGGRRPVTAPRVLGALLALVAVGLAGPGDASTPGAPLLLTLVVLAGALVAVQQGLNGRVRAATDVGVATLVNFTVGTTALLLVLLGVVVVGGAPSPDWPAQWWLYLGGPIGVLFIGVAAATVRVLGVLRLGLAVTAGQVLGALLLDAALPLADAALTPATLLGALLTVLAVGVAGRTRLVPLRGAPLAGRPPTPTPSPGGER